MTLRLVLTDGNGIQGLAATFGAYINTSISDAQQYAAQAANSASNAATSATQAANSATAAATSATQAANSASAAATSAANASNSATAASGSASAASTSAANAANSATAAATSASNAATSETNAANSATAAATSASNAAATLANAVLVDGSRAMTGNLNRADVATTYRAFGYTTSGSLRWNHGASAQSETGGNAGSNWILQRFSDAGAVIDTPITVSRATGQMSLSVRPLFNSNTPYDSGNLPSTAMVWTVSQTFTNGGIGGGNISVNVDGGSGFSKYFRVSNNGSVRWGIGGDSTTESGSNAGSNFFINRYDDTGTLLGSVITITRASGNITFNGGTLNMSGNRIINGADPINAQDFATKNYTDQMRGRNRIINGSMQVDQRNSGVAVTPGSGATYCLDRWQAITLGAASKLTFQQVADAPPGFKYSLKVTVASQYAPAVSDAFSLSQTVEGLNVIDFALGTSGATNITTSAQVKSSITGTFACRLVNGSSNRSYVATYTIGSANTWTPLVLTVAGDITGTWATDNTAGISVGFDLGSGSNFNATAGSWQAGNFTRTSGSVTFVNQTAGSTWQITAVQLEKGNVATPYEQKIVSDVIKDCQRYYYRVSGGANAGNPIGTGMAYSANQLNVYHRAPVSMRAPPSFNAANVAAFNTTGGPVNANSFALFSGSSEGVLVNYTMASSSWSAGQASQFFVGSTSLAGYIELNAEL